MFTHSPELITIPYGYDPHAHGRTPGKTKSENPRTLTEAALAGGYLGANVMPNDNPLTSTLNRLQKKRDLYQCKIVFDI